MSKFFLLLVFIISNCYSIQSQEILINKQKDSINFNNEIYKYIYQIKLCNFPLIIELVEKSDGQMFGYINIVIDRNFEGKFENFVGQVPINDLIVKKLIYKFKEIDLESVKNCNENDDCEYGLDGVDTYIKIKYNKAVREYIFWELIPNQIITSKTPQNRIRGQKILDELDKELNLNNKNHELRHKLPKGLYSYWTGNGIAQYNID